MCRTGQGLLCQLCFDARLGCYALRTYRFDLFFSHHVRLLLLLFLTAKQGADLSSDLWSARLLNDNPSLIRETHLAYLRAGADVATSASYQASYEGFLVS